MARFTGRQAEFQGLATSHQDAITALLAGTMLEVVRYRVSFAMDNFSNASFRLWRTARVGWGLWFGPQSDPVPDWSSDRDSGNWIWWQASPWIPDYESVASGDPVVITPGNSYRAGIFGAAIEIPVYRTAVGATYELRHVDEASDLAAFSTYSYASETWLDLWAP